MSWFSSLWKKKTEKTAVPVEPRPPAPALNDEEGLKKNFREAAHGNFCRTRGYIPQNSTKSIAAEWLEACHIPGQGWQVSRMQLIPPQDKEEPFLLSQEAYNNSFRLTFFEAIEKLALYEISQSDLGFFPSSGEEPKSLGFDHFKAFAEREKIIFDVEGIPHPTINGRPIGGKLYTMPRTENKTADQEQATKSLSSADLEKLRKMIEEADTILMHMRRVRSDAAQCMSSDAWFYREALAGRKIGNAVGTGVEDAYLSLHESARKILVNGGPCDTQNDSSAVTVAREMFAYAFCLAEAAFIHTLHVKKGGCTHKHSDYCTAESVGAFRSRAVQALKNLNHEGDLEDTAYRTFRSFCDDFEQGDRKRPFEALDSIIRHIEDIQMFCEKKIGIRTVRDIAALPAVPALHNLRLVGPP